MRVSAILLGRGDERLREAITAQARAPDETQVAGPGGPPVSGSGAEWIWLLDGSAVPEPAALAELLAALDSRELPDPVLVASRIVDASGELDPDHRPWPRLTDKQVAVDACAQRLVSLRMARHGSLLVSRAAVERHGLPRNEPGADLEWTARLLRAEFGYLAPRSIAVSRPEREQRSELRSGLRMLGGDGLALEEKLWFGLSLAQDAAAHIRSAVGRVG